MAEMKNPSQVGYYPPLNFHFQVHFEDLGNAGDVQFQSVGGLSVQMQTETLKEGGENRFEHIMPVRTKYNDLVLKRGMLNTDSPVTKWIQEALDNFQFAPKNLTVFLYGEDRSQPLLVWKVTHAWPKSWKVDDLNAEQGKVLIETIELTYNYFKLQNG